MPEVQFLGETCAVNLERYQNNGALALQLVIKDTGEPMTVATVNLPEPLDWNEVAIKDYSENEGVLDAMLSAGLLKAPHRLVQSGFVTIPVCQISDVLIEAMLPPEEDEDED